MFEMYRDEKNLAIIVAMFDDGVALTYGGEA